MSPEAVTSFFALALGFSIAAMLTHLFQAVSNRPASFRLLEAGAVPAAFAAVPFLMFAAPFIIMRTTLRRDEQSMRRIQFVASATIFAGFWSLMSGTWVIMALEALGLVAV